MLFISRRKQVEDTWLLQTLAIVFSILSIGAIAVLLAHYDNKSIFDWNGVTLNAVVAVFAAITKALLAFAISDCLGQSKWIWFSWQQRPLKDLDLIDNASRGPLGSLKLLRRPVGRSFISFGTIVVILSVAIDPFVQLTVGKRNALVYENYASTQIVRAQRYSKGVYTPLIGQLGNIEMMPVTQYLMDVLTSLTVNGTDGNTYYKTTADADFGMKSAVQYGISQPDALVTQQTNQTCPSANCTWAAFQSLAVCSACTDLTDQLHRGVSDQAAPLDLFLGSSGSYASSNTEPNTEYRLPNGLRLNNQEDKSSTTWMTGYGTGKESQSMSFSSKSTLIWSMAMIKVQDPQAKWPSSPVTALECGLWYCVNEYSPLVEKGILIENSAPALSTRSPTSWQISPNQPSFTVPQKLKNPPPNTLNYYDDSASLLRSDLELGAGFNMSQTAVYGISKAMNETFWTKPDVNKGVQVPRFINAYVLNRDALTYSPTVMQILYNSSDLNATFSALAKSMTNSIRANSDAKLVQIGKAGSYNALIQVRWPYLILPALLTLAGGVFLIIVIHHTHAAGIAVWCSNAMPSVALGGRLGALFDDSLLLSRMGEIAKLQAVQFPRLKEDSRPDGATNLREEAGQEMTTLGGSTKSRSRITRSVSDASQDGLDVGDERQSRVHLV